MNNGNMSYWAWNGSDVVYQSPEGSKYDQVSLLANYLIVTHPDGDVGIRLNGGAAYLPHTDVIRGNFGIDLVAFFDKKFYPYLSWNVVPNGKFGEGDARQGDFGWVHSVTLNMAIKL